MENQKPTYTQLDESPRPIKKFLFLIVTAIVLILVVFAFLFFNRAQRGPDTQTPGTTQPTTIPTRTPENLPKSTELLPTTAPGLVNTGAPETQRAISAIEKLYIDLPFTHTTTLSTGVPVSIGVPSQEYQDRSWTLQVYIDGINYQAANPQDPEYDLMRRSFLEASEIVFDWIESQNVKPNDIFITWGDRVYIQEAAQHWLSTQ